ncbi:MAG: winged helix-turn-helix domain-containing protein [Clostridia bacterium]|nr:winged helix-turn-helix domain-containing protein [Clostridia bacterium]
MKKNIAFVNADPSLINWLMDSLNGAPRDIDGNELCASFADLLSGDISSLMIGMQGDMAFSPVVLGSKNLKIYPAARKVTRGDEEIILTPKEFDILLFLAKNKGEVFTKEQIYQAVWEQNYLLDDSNIMAFIRKLRKKIEINPDKPEYILTIWGIGYKFSDN